MPLSAQETLGGTGLSVSPLVINMDLKKGQETKQIIIIKNNSNKDTTVDLSLRAFRPENGDSGKMIFPTSEDNFSSLLSDWTKIDRGKALIPKGKEENIIISVKVPANVSPRDLSKKHYVAIVISPEKETNSNSVSIKQEIASAIVAQFRLGTFAKIYYLAITNALWTLLTTLAIVIIAALIFKKPKRKKKFYEKPLG